MFLKMCICLAAVPGCPGPQFAKDTRQDDARPVCLLSQAGTSANGGGYDVMFTLSHTTEDTLLQFILWYQEYRCFNNDREALTNLSISYKVLCVFIFNLSNISMFYVQIVRYRQ